MCNKLGTIYRSATDEKRLVSNVIPEFCKSAKGKANEKKLKDKKLWFFLFSLYISKDGSDQRVK